MSELKPNQLSDWHIDGVAVHAADGAGLRGCINPSHPDFAAAVEALKALVPEPFEWEITDRPRGGREAGGGGMKKPNPCISVYGPGPDGARCKTCAHLDGHPGAGRIYWKCLLRAYSHGPGTDHRVNWPACRKYEEVADA